MIGLAPGTIATVFKENSFQAVFDPPLPMGSHETLSTALHRYALTNIELTKTNDEIKVAAYSVPQGKDLSAFRMAMRFCADVIRHDANIDYEVT